MKSMVLAKDNGIKYHHTCPTCLSVVGDGEAVNDEIIPTFYSDQHAADSGWRKTKHIMFCDPTKDFVWVCPDCWPGDSFK